ncbi:hypothetical protein [Gracilimonas sediminicola]|uniref:Uncharacterized protein n=1 Tax=Gracilimonas sediminicola TaxID=2952158 RepID=A0A9X2RE64_9BACT|nr:hypothetical protein [Gracilimonas sediminicola]MCP9290023.1 hypothetical protein [Gracilimonas sediminicola]
MIEGWIKLHRQFIKWEWYDDANVMRVFLHCLLLANHEDKKWRGKMIKRGTFITSYSKLGAALKLSVKQVRLALEKLEETKELARKTTNQYTVIKVCNYDTYQNNEKEKGTQNDKRGAIKGQSKGNQRATTKNDNNYKNDKNSTHTPARTVPPIDQQKKNLDPEADIPSKEEFVRYCVEDCRYTKSFADHLWNHLMSKGWEIGGEPVKSFRHYVNKQRSWNTDFNQKQKTNAKTRNKSSRDFKERLDNLEALNEVQ